jgi:hypothetical protein
MPTDTSLDITRGPDDLTPDTARPSDDASKHTAALMTTSHSVEELNVRGVPSSQQ